ncbi:hypothetical protein RCL1_000732 [Eukaryota sp. TZLM3-RCL]
MTHKCLLKNCTVLSSDFVTIQLLDRGQFGVVYLVQDSSAQQFALKVCQRKDIAFLRERDFFVSRIDSPFLVKYFHVFEEDLHAKLVMEYVPGGSLSSIAHSLSNDDISFIFVQLVLGLRHLHLMSVIHRDIKPANILVVNQMPPHFIKICDFGTSKNIDGTIAHSFVGSPAYQAPELRARKAHGTAVDFYSLGVVLYELTEKRLPFPDLVISDSNPFHEVIQGLLVSDPIERFTFEQLTRIELVANAFDSFHRIQLSFESLHNDSLSKILSLNKRITELEDNQNRTNQIVKEKSAQCLVYHNEVVRLRKLLIQLGVDPDIGNNSGDSGDVVDIQESHMIEVDNLQTNEPTTSNVTDSSSMLERAEDNDAEALYELGRMHIGPNDMFSYDIELGFSYLNRAIELDHTPSMILMAKTLLKKRESIDQAITLLSRAHELGDVNSIGYLANCYYHGNGVPKDQHYAFELAKKGRDSSEPQSVYLLAEIYDEGVIVAQNDDVAMKYLEEAVDLGHEYAKSRYEQVKQNKRLRMPNGEINFMSLEFITGEEHRKWDI